MRILLDEMHAPSVAVALQSRGIEAAAAAATPALRGMTDVDLLTFAAAEGYALVTENVGDFSLLHARWLTEGRSHAGVVYSNPKRFDRASLACPGALIEALVRFTRRSPVAGDTWIWWLD